MHVVRRLFLVFMAVLGVGCAPSLEAKSAGEIGCPPEEIEIANEDGSSGWIQGTSTWVALCRGRRFVCSETSTRGEKSLSSQISCRPEVGSQPAPAQTAPPAAASPASSRTPARAAAGFNLGASSDASKSACERGGKTWTAVDGTRAQCSGPATDIGFSAEVELTLSEGRTTAITIVHVPKSGWFARVKALKAALVDKYGNPTDKVTVPFSCREESQIEQCLRDGTARMEFSWSWPTGERILLVVGRSRADGKPLVMLRYGGTATQLNSAGL